MFEAKVRFLDKERKIMWDKGELSGDHAMVLFVTMAAKAREGTPVGPGEGPVCAEMDLPITYCI